MKKFLAVFLAVFTLLTGVAILTTPQVSAQACSSDNSGSCPPCPVGTTEGQDCPDGNSACEGGKCVPFRTLNISGPKRGGGIAVGAPLPLGNISLQGYIGRIIRQALGFVGIIGLIVFVYGGVMYMTAAGNDERIKKAKSTLIWAVLGMIMVFAAYGIVAAVVNVLERA